MIRNLQHASLKWLCGGMLLAGAPGCGPEGSEDSVPSVRGTAEQLSKASTSVAERRATLKRHFAQRRSELNVVATTQTRHGQSLDWVPRESQAPSGVRLTPPPPLSAPSGECTECLTGNELGPEGTVPILRMDTDDFINRIDPPPSVEDFLSRGGRARAAGGGPMGPGSLAVPGTNLHAASWTAHSQNIVGTDAFFTALAPYVERNDEFSLTQVWIQGLANSQTKDSVEAGVMKFQQLFGDQLPHFFVYFTNNAYVFSGDYFGGYDQLVKGWSQSSSTFFPGQIVAAGTTVHTEVLWYAGWWVWSSLVNDWIGVYPGTLFTTPGLKQAADVAGWGGEVVDATGNNVTTATDMGNGLYAQQSGAAKIRNIRYLSGTPYAWKDWDTQFPIIEKSNCWNVDDHSKSGTSDGSYLYYGGPGNNPYFCP